MFTKADIEKYFVAEKHAGLLFLSLGIIAVLLAMTFFFFLKTSFAKGAAIPLLVIGCLQLFAGYTVYAHRDRQRIDNVYAFDMNPSKLKNEELPRMQAVNKNFVTYRWIEIVLMVTGMVLAIGCKGNPAKSFLFGLGLMLAVEAAMMLGVDYFAGRRAVIYTMQLEKME
jgi:hypothetical protein